MQDSYWIAIDHGLVDAAKRQGVKMTIYQAGGYSNLPRQVAQYDDCMASGADAILIGAISEAGMAAKITEGMEKGIVNIALANPVLGTPITARITPDYYQKGYQGALYAGEKLGEGATAIAFPGLQGSGWAETYLQGFVDGAKEAGITVDGEYFDEASAAVLHGGRHIATLRTAEVTDAELIEKMVGRPVDELFPQIDNVPGVEALLVTGLSTRAGTVRGASIRARKGEIVGLSGLMGCGRPVPMWGPICS